MASGINKTVKIFHNATGPAGTFKTVNIVAPGPTGVTGSTPTWLSGGTTGTDQCVIGVTGGTNNLFETVSVANGW
jgi:hypothetical protein